MTLPIHIERSRGAPVYQQIEDGIRGLLERGLLQPGDRLPTTRDLAGELGINRSTVVAAYRALIDAGLAGATIGCGTFISAAAPGTVRATAGGSIRRLAGAGGRNRQLQRRGSGAALTPWQPTFSRAIESATLQATAETEPIVDHPDLVDFAALAPDEDLFPVGEFRELMTRLLEERGQEVLQYGSAQGDPDLRELIAGDLQAADIEVTADEVVIVNGIQQGIDLTLRLLVDPGDVVVVESPTYVSMLPALGLYRAEVAEVPMTPRGLDLERLAQLAARRRPRLIYSMPNFQNPTGVTMDLETRHGLLEIAAEHGIAILEDDYEKDLRLEGQGLPCLMSLDRAGLVLHMGTFSKGLFPGLRLGWIAAPAPLISRLNLAKRLSDLHTSSLIQAAVAAFCSGGHYRRHVEKLKRVYRERQGAILAAMQRHLPAAISWTHPEGGLVLWVTLPDHVTAEAILREARTDGVIATPGTYFFHGNQGEHHVRLSFARTGPVAIERGIRVLGDVIRRRLAEPPPAARPRRPARALPRL